MALTYQPFAEVPEVSKLRRDLDMNVPDPERAASVAAGAALGVAGLGQRGLMRWLMILGGIALARRGLTGHCDLYAYLDLDRRHPGAGVPGNRGTRAEHSIEVNCSPQVLYHFWRDLTQLPQIMRHVESVEVRNDEKSHWTVKGPGGKSLEWDARIINDEPGRMLAWESLPGAAVRNAGSVWFEKQGSGGTRVKVAMEYDPPAGALGVAFAKLFDSSAQEYLEEDLARFKEFAESELEARTH
jgi:uncharacterized membrane protein